MNPSKINLRALDALRGLLATYVLAGHARWLLWAGWQEWGRQPHGTLANALAAGSAFLRYGHEAVMVFFVLSGFFIHLRAAGHLNSPDGANFRLGIKDFFTRRARRLVPPYAFALLLTLGLDIAGSRFYPALYIGTTGDSLLDQTLGHGGFGMMSIAPALVMLPGSLGFSFGSNGPLWSLGYEVVYYLLYPAWLLLRQTAGARLAYGLGGLCFLLPFLHVPPAWAFISSVLAHYPVWLAGAALVEVAVRNQWPRWSRSVALFILGGVFFAIQRRGMSLNGLLPLYLLGGTAVVLLFTRMPGTVSSWRVSRLAESLGICSYTIYICHFPILVFLSSVLFRIYGTRPYMGGFAFGGAVAAILLCRLFFQFCEQPFLSLGRKRTASHAPSNSVV